MKNNHKYLNFEQAHTFVEQQPSTLMKEVFWDGYEIVIWKTNAAGYMVKNGMFRNGSWGTARRIKMSDRGTWRTPVTP